MESMRMLERMKKWQQAMREAAQNYGTVPEPPKVAAPAVPESAYDRTRIGRTTVQGVANTLTNENRALHGSGLDQAEYAMARAIIRGQLEPKLRRSIAPDTAPRRLSPEEQRRAQERLRIARQAFIDAKLGKADPAGGNTSYNHRDVRDVIRNRPRVGEPVYRNFGPFQNAHPTRSVGKDAYIVFYENNPVQGQHPQQRPISANKRKRQ